MEAPPVPKMRSRLAEFLDIIIPNLAGVPSAKNHLSPSANALHTFSLAVVLCVSGCYVSWNAILASGFGSGFLALLLVAAGYVTLMMCVCELSSAVPFSGGSYGFSRVAFGHLPSVVVGLAELLEYCLCAAIEALACAHMISLMGLQDSGDGSSGPMLEGLWMLFVYLVWNALLWDPRVFWFAMVAGMVSTFGILFFYLVSIWSVLPYSSTSFTQNAAASRAVATFLQMAPDNPAVARLPNWFTPNFMHVEEVASNPSANAAAGFFSVLPIGIWFLCGVEGSVLAAEETLDGKTTVAAGAVPAICVYAVVCLIVLISATAMPAGIYSLVTCTYASPLGCGFEQVWPSTSSDPFTSNWFDALGFVGTFWSGLALLYASSRVLFALSRAGHMPPVFAVTNACASPYRATYMCSCVGYVICLITRYASTHREDGKISTNTEVYSKVVTVVFNLLVIGGLVMYFAIFACFFVMRRRLNHIPRSYRSPLHLTGCVYGSVCFVLCFVSIWMFQPYMKETALGLVVWFASGVVYYFVWGRFRLLLSPEERFALPARRVDAHQILQTGLGFTYLREFAATEHSTEVPDCWAAASEYLKSPSVGKFYHLFTKFIQANAPQQVNLPSELSHALQLIYVSMSTLCTAMGGSISDAAQSEEPDFQPQNRKVIKYNVDDEMREILEGAVSTITRLQDELSRIVGMDTLSRFFTSPQFSAYLTQEPLLFAPHNVDNLTRQTRQATVRRSSARYRAGELGRQQSRNKSTPTSPDSSSRRNSTRDHELTLFDSSRNENPTEDRVAAYDDYGHSRVSCLVPEIIELKTEPDIGGVKS